MSTHFAMLNPKSAREPSSLYEPIWILRGSTADGSRHYATFTKGLECTNTPRALPFSLAGLAIMGWKIAAVKWTWKPENTGLAEVS